MSAPHRFTRKELERGKVLPAEAILRFIEHYREIHLPRARQRSKLISLKLSEALLEAFKEKSQLDGVPYQTQIKALMREWLK